MFLIIVKQYKINMYFYDLRQIKTAAINWSSSVFVVYKSYAWTTKLLK